MNDRKKRSRPGMPGAFQLAPGEALQQQVERHRQSTGRGTMAARRGRKRRLRSACRAPGYRGRGAVGRSCRVEGAQATGRGDLQISTTQPENNRIRTTTGPAVSREPQTYLAQRFWIPTRSASRPLAPQLEARHNDTEVPVHRHRKGQLVVACRGGITCTVPDGLWMVPAGFGVWIPGGIAHSNRVTANGKVCFLFVEPGAARLPSDCCTLALSPLVLGTDPAPERATAGLSARRPARTSRRGAAGTPGTGADRTALTCRCRTTAASRRIADELTRAPGDRASMAEWARRVAMSERSLARMVRRETGSDLRPVAPAIADHHRPAATVRRRFGATHRRDPGYESVSSFIGMLRKALGSPRPATCATACGGQPD